MHNPNQFELDDETSSLVDGIVNGDALNIQVAADITQQEPVAAEPVAAVVEEPAPVAPAAVSIPPPQPFDFSKVEALRKHMLVTTADMAEIFGVSRVTYYNWIKGGPVRKTNAAIVRAQLAKLLKVMKDGWPYHDVIIMEPRDRFAALLEKLKELT